MIKNFHLLIEDIKYPFIKIFRSRKLEQDLFVIENKKEVLHLYRHMIKNIPPMHNNSLDHRRTYEEIKFNFHEGSRETDFEVICFLKNTCYIIIEKINKGVYPPFPIYKS